MNIGILKEGSDEKRVVIIPRDIKILRDSGADVYVEQSAGLASGFHDDDYSENGAIVVDRSTLINNCKYILMLKPPVASFFNQLCREHVVMGLFHAEGDVDLVRKMLNSKATFYTYEFFKNSEGDFPAASVGGAIAGKSAFMYGMYFLQQHLGGAGIFLGQINRMQKREKIVVIGYGNVGGAVIEMALAIGCHVVVFGRSISPRKNRHLFVNSNIEYHRLDKDVLIQHLKDASLIIGAILISTFDTPPILNKSDVVAFKKGSVVIDVTCGYGDGYFPFFPGNTTLENPCLCENGVSYIKIDNLPKAFHRTYSDLFSENISNMISPFLKAQLESSLFPLVENGMIVRNGLIVHNEIERHYDRGQT